MSMIDKHAEFKALIHNISLELSHQREKWGDGWIDQDKEWVAILAEELGEVARARLMRNRDEYRRELEQLGAVVFAAWLAVMKLNTPTRHAND